MQQMTSFTIFLNFWYFFILILLNLFRYFFYFTSMLFFCCWRVEYCDFLLLGIFDDLYIWVLWNYSFSILNCTFYRFIVELFYGCKTYEPNLPIYFLRTFCFILKFFLIFQWPSVSVSYLTKRWFPTSILDKNQVNLIEVTWLHSENWIIFVKSFGAFVDCFLVS